MFQQQEPNEQVIAKSNEEAKEESKEYDEVDENEASRFVAPSQAAGEKDLQSDSDSQSSEKLSQIPAQQLQQLGSSYLKSIYQSVEAQFLTK